MMILPSNYRRKEVILDRQEDDLMSLYVLTDPETYEIRYIGVARDPESRLRQHLRRQSTPPMLQWFAALKERGLKPRMFIILTETRREVFATEQALIMQCKIEGARLLNMGEKYANYEP